MKYNLSIIHPIAVCLEDLYIYTISGVSLQTHSDGDHNVEVITASETRKLPCLIFRGRSTGGTKVTCGSSHLQVTLASVAVLRMVIFCLLPSSRKYRWL